MKCDKCGYDFSNSGDSAHVCTAMPLDTVLRNAIMRSAKVVQPKREWVGLTDEEIKGITLASGDSIFSAIMFTHDKLKEKNT